MMSSRVVGDDRAAAQVIEHGSLASDRRLEPATDRQRAGRLTDLPGTLQTTR